MPQGKILVHTFRADFAMQCFENAVVRRVAGSVKVESDVDGMCSGIEITRDKVSAIVALDCARVANVGKETFPPAQRGRKRKGVG